MKIILFTSKNLHGYLNFSIPIRPDLTFLTGINGSGKTSAVRAMTSLLTPSIPALASMAYSSVSVTVLHEGEELIVSSTRSDDQIELSYGQGLEPVQIPVLKPDAYESRMRFQERERDFYREQEAINSLHPTLAAIEKLPTPMFLDIERRHQEGVRARRPIRFSRASPVNPLAGTVIESLADAQVLAEANFREFLAIRTQISDTLKEDLILAAFRQVRTWDQMNFWNDRPGFLTDLTNSERVVRDSLTRIGISAEQLQMTVMPFFEQVKRVAAKMPLPETVGSAEMTSEVIETLQEWSGLEPQVGQINFIASRISRYNAEISEKYQLIDRYLKSINRFLSDGDKRIGFDDSGNLGVYVSEEMVARNIGSLSSGERQLVVILTHLAFNRRAKRANILIIDEPELSLHLRWQEMFVDAVIDAGPDLQLLLATHSPSIIKGRVENCIDVGEARQSDRLLA